MLKTSSTELAKSRKSGTRVGGDSKVKCDRSGLDKSEINDVEVDGGKIRDNEVRKKNRKISMSKNMSIFKKAIRSDFFTPRTGLEFTRLKKAFVKALIFQDFNPERYIWVEIDISSYAIGGVISQVTSNDFGQ